MDKDLIKKLDDTNKKYYQFGVMDTKAIWNHLREKYINNPTYEERKFDDIINCIADEFEVYNKDVREKLAPTQELLTGLNGLERQHNKLRKAILDAKDWIKTANYPAIIRFLKLTTLWTWIKERNKFN